MLLKFLRGLYRINHALDTIARLESELDAWRSHTDVPESLISEYQLARRSDEYLSVYKKPNPLVSVCIATYNRGPLLAERCVASVLGQDYQNLEILVVGDCCTDDTAERLTAISDPRLKFINLPERGRYPERPEWRWMVAGTTPVNHALELARGDFITHLDDDDRYAPDRIRHLVTSMQQQPADFIFHPFWHEYVPDKWRLNQAERLSSGYVTTSSIFYHRWLACIPWDINAYKTREPGDFNRIRKLKHLGIVTRRYPQPLLWHYRERSQPPR
jgi:glycosyltransferase involved in cell wall biosynthesis